MKLSLLNLSNTLIIACSIFLMSCVPDTIKVNIKPLAATSTKAKLNLSNYVVTGAPTGTNTTTSLNASVVSMNPTILFYKYKVGRSVSTNCQTATGYSSATLLSTPITNSISGLTDGSITLCIVAVDNLANEQSLAEATILTWTKDTTGPTATISGNHSTYGSADTFSLTVSAATPSDISTYRYKIGSASIDCVDPTGYSSATTVSVAIADTISSFSANATSNNTKVCVVGIDALGNQQAYSAATSASWITDFQAPVATITGAPVSESQDPQLSISVSAVTSSDIVSYRYKLGLLTTTDCSSSSDYSSDIASSSSIDDDLSAENDGPLKLCVLAKDAAGNEQALGSATTTTWQFIRAKVSLGNSFGCFIDREGNLRCWGTNNFGQVGNSTTIDAPSAVIIDSGVKYKEITNGANHTCGITVGGVLKCWGYNSSGQIGDGTTTTRLSPIVIDSGTLFTNVSASTNNTCAITTIGVLKCWGANGYGQIGDGTTTARVSPTVIDSALTYSKVSIGQLHTCAVRTTGAIKCWGYNYYGAIGDGSNISTRSPVAINSSATYKDVVVGYYSTCALKTSGGIECWGDNTYGQLGLGSTTQYNSPQAVDSSTSYLSISLRVSLNYAEKVCAITTAGVLKCWGANNNYQIGDGTSSDRRVPTVIDSGVTYSQVFSASAHTCGMTIQGELRCWGSNSNFSFGIRSYNNPTISTPTIVTTPLTLTGTPSGVSFSTSLSINVNTSASNIVGIQMTGYAYKITTSLYNCFLSANYSAIMTMDDDITDDISSLPDGEVDLCIVPVNEFGTIQNPVAAVIRSWVKITRGTLSYTNSFASTDSYSFGPVAGTSNSTFTLYNIGPLDITGLSVNLPSSAFSFEGTGVFPGSTGTCTDTIAAGTTCTFTLSYNPSSSNDSALMIFTYDNGIIPNATYSIGLGGSIAVYGCTSSNASNYDPNANIDDSTCTYPIPGCTNSGAVNYNPSATADDGSCAFPISGCMDSSANNYNPNANANDGSCTYTVPGCTDPSANNYNPSANTSDGSCTYNPISGCMDSNANNYNSSAVTDNGSCTYTVNGCTDPSATNFNPSANMSDGSCTYPPPIVYGCTDMSASNFNSSATSDDGSCSYPPPPDVYGCTDSTAANYNSTANVNDGSCTYNTYGCTDASADNYNPSANVSDASCTYGSNAGTVYGCTDPGAANYNSSANASDSSCWYYTYGCTDWSANNYNPSANMDDGSCTY